jgi:FkbM family methyltransferase
MLSYAQNQEDVLLWRVFADVPAAEGFYIDVGANHPVIDSVTKHFYDAGWHGINVEPVQEHADRLAAERPRDVNIHAAIGSEAGTLTLHRVVDNDGLSTFDDGLANGYRGEGMTIVSEDVPVHTLRTVWDDHVDGPVHFLKIDVEGHEEQVIAGADWSRHRPYVLVIEATKPETWEHQLDTAGYHRVLDDGINYVYVADEHPELVEGLRRPVTVVDRFTPFEWLRRVEPMQLTLTHYGANAITDELLSQVRRHPTTRQRSAARRLVDVFVRRDDLVRTFCSSGQLDHLGLLGWALDLDPAVDPAIAELQSIRPDLEDLRDRIEARRG